MYIYLYGWFKSQPQTHPTLPKTENNNFLVLSGREGWEGWKGWKGNSISNNHSVRFTNSARGK